MRGFSHIPIRDTAHTASKPYNSSTPIAGQSRDSHRAISRPRMLIIVHQNAHSDLLPLNIQRPHHCIIPQPLPGRGTAIFRPIISAISQPSINRHSTIILSDRVRPHHPAIPSPDMPADSAWLSGLLERSLAGSGGAWLGTE